MSIERLTKVVQKLGEILEIHASGTVDPRAAELLQEANSILGEVEAEDLDEMEWMEECRLANLVNTTR